MSGPLPSPDRRRRNAPTIPTTSLPVGGRRGETPAVPSWVVLGEAGLAWWVWAWGTPQAAAWDAGSVSVVARRASLEDRFAAADERSVAAISRAMEPLENRLGLTPKGLAELRWKIVADVEDEDEQGGGATVISYEDRRSRLLG